MPLGNPLSLAVASWIAGATFPAPPEQVFVGLSSTAPLGDGTGVTEPLAAAGYARVPVEFAVKQTLPDGYKIMNKEPVAFGPVINTVWPAITHVLFFDQDGDILAYGALGASFVLLPGNTKSFGATALQAKIR